MFEEQGQFKFHFDDIWVKVLMVSVESDTKQTWIFSIKEYDDFRFTTIEKFAFHTDTKCLADFRGITTCWLNESSSNRLLSMLTEVKELSKFPSRVLDVKLESNLYGLLKLPTFQSNINKDKRKDMQVTLAKFWGSGPCWTFRPCLYKYKNKDNYSLGSKYKQLCSMVHTKTQIL